MGADREKTDLADAPATVAAAAANDWFVREVLPLEAELVQFLRRSWRNQSDIDDLCQDIYIRAYQSARKEIPKSSRALLFTIARNRIVDLVRGAQVVPIETVADLETLNIADDRPSPDRGAIAHQELLRLQAALDRMPPRCREAVIFKKIEGLTVREIAARMGIAAKTVDRHLSDGACFLADFVYGDCAGPGRKP